MALIKSPRAIPKVSVYSKSFSVVLAGNLKITFPTLANISKRVKTLLPRLTDMVMGEQSCVRQNINKSWIDDSPPHSPRLARIVVKSPHNWKKANKSKFTIESIILSIFELMSAFKQLSDRDGFLVEYRASLYPNQKPLTPAK